MASTQIVKDPIEGKIEVAKNLLKLGVSLPVIVKATGLSEKEILKLKKSKTNKNNKQKKQ